MISRFIKCRRKYATNFYNVLFKHIQKFARTVFIFRLDDILSLGITLERFSTLRIIETYLKNTTSESRLVELET